LHFLSRVERESEFVGLDLEGGAVSRANEQYSRRGSLSYVRGDAEKLPFDDAQFDAVINIESSHTYPNLRGFVSEVARVLRPNGYFSHVDLFSDDRLQCMNQCKRDSASELTWLAETEITDRVKDSIRRRMAPGSLFRQQLAHAYRYIPWPMSVAVTAFGMYGYGRSFADPGNATWSRLLPWRRTQLNLTRVFKSYWHTLAQKPAR
jgi:ubiquinone/menaquinone biosynthesis C-methylase UbiE